MREALTPRAQALRDLRRAIEDQLAQVDDLIRRQDAIDDAEVNADLDAWAAQR